MILKKKTTKKKRNSLYPDILFHFTKRDGLFGILEHTFKLSISVEHIVGIDKSREFGAPMVSFCDLRLSELKDHMNKYGKYGIGLSKEWANRMGLNPVFYVNKDSPFVGNFMNAVEKLFAHLETIDDADEHTVVTSSYMHILEAYRYIKNYEGDLKRANGSITKNYRFADEREWRYVLPQNAKNLPFIPFNVIGTPEQKAEFNKIYQNYKLAFEPEDIKYLIVALDRERLELIEHLHDVKDGFPQHVITNLASRILTAEQISRDI